MAEAEYVGFGGARGKGWNMRMAVGSLGRWLGGSLVLWRGREMAREGRLKVETRIDKADAAE
jgi:hypothetical protein